MTHNSKSLVRKIQRNGGYENVLDKSQTSLNGHRRSLAAKLKRLKCQHADTSTRANRRTSVEISAIETTLEIINSLIRKNLQT